MAYGNKIFAIIFFWSEFNGITMQLNIALVAVTVVFIALCDCNLMKYQSNLESKDQHLISEAKSRLRRDTKGVNCLSTCRCRRKREVICNKINCLSHLPTSNLTGIQGQQIYRITVSRFVH